MPYSFMLAKEYTKEMKPPRNDEHCLPPIGWLVSEKYDGYRARFVSQKDNLHFISRQQKLFVAPEWFKLAMPPGNDLDGELWVGRDNFQQMGCVRKKIPINEEWMNVKYIVYDVPDVNKPFCERLKILKDLVKKNKTRWEILRKKLDSPMNTMDCPIVLARQVTVKSHDHLDGIYKKIINNGGEGIMIKDPGSLYEDKRSNYMLKYKPSFDEEAIIVDYKHGKGKYEGILGGFICKPLINIDTYHIVDKKEEHEFAISGMDDDVRNDYKLSHPIGTVISYEHSGKTDSGKPRFARYVRKREDITIKDKVDKISTEKRDNIIHILKTLADYEKANGQAFKANSYLKAVSSLKSIIGDNELSEQHLRSLNGIGKSIYEKIHLIITTGSCPHYESINKLDDPRKLFMDIHGVGPKCANHLVKQGFTTIQELRDCESIHEYLNDKQMIGLQYYEDLLKRIPRQEIQKHEVLLKRMIQKVDPEADLTIAGSYRREKEDSGDIDVLLKCKDMKTYKKFIQHLTSLGYLVENLALGNKKYNGICKLGKRGMNRRIDIMFTKPEEYPFAVLYFTGSDNFNKQMRQDILDKGMSINEYSLKDNISKEKVNHVFVSEKDIFNYLNIDYVEPCDR